MKKILPLFLAVMLVVAMAVPAFAESYEFYESFSGSTVFYDGTDYVNFTDLVNTFLTMSNADDVHYIYLTEIYPTFTTELGGFLPVVSFQAGIKLQYDADLSAWVFVEFFDQKSLQLDYVRWANYDVLRPDGSLFLKGDTDFANFSFCDGSACPATDANFDNVCDDCGTVLTYNLRSTTLDYARSLAQAKYSDGYPYYAIFLSGSTYIVHISKTPMTSPSGTDLDGSGIMYNRISQSSDGVNGGSGWYNGFYQSYDEFVEANHSISNFLPAPPLAMEIQGVTEEQMTKLLPEMVGTMKTLALCGVGCLALLVVLKLFGKRSLIYRN